jgi:hypothetical protein
MKALKDAAGEDSMSHADALDEGETEEENWECNSGCGFRGALSAVAVHEALCSHQIASMDNWERLPAEEKEKWNVLAAAAKTQHERKAATSAKADAALAIALGRATMQRGLHRSRQTGKREAPPQQESKNPEDNSCTTRVKFPTAEERRREHSAPGVEQTVHTALSAVGPVENVAGAEPPVNAAPPPFDLQGGTRSCAGAKPVWSGKWNRQNRQHGCPFPPSSFKAVAAHERECTVASGTSIAVALSHPEQEILEGPQPSAAGLVVGGWRFSMDCGRAVGHRPASKVAFQGRCQRACTGPDFAWKAQLARLVAYKAAHGDCNVPVGWAEDPHLGMWVMIQRGLKSKLDRGEHDLVMTVERAAMLTALGFS